MKPNRLNPSLDYKKEPYLNQSVEMPAFNQDLEELEYGHECANPESPFVDADFPLEIFATRRNT